MNDTNPLCEPRSGGQGGAPLSSAARRSPGRSARYLQRLLLASVLAGAAGCVTPTVPIGPPVAGASKYRLHENGALRYEGPDLAFAVADRADGSYFYALTYCVLASEHHDAADVRSIRGLDDRMRPVGVQGSQVAAPVAVHELHERGLAASLDAHDDVAAGVLGGIGVDKDQVAVSETRRRSHSDSSREARLG